MKVFYSCTTAELLKYKEIYLKIREIIIENGHILTRDWLLRAIERIESGDAYQNPKQFFGKVLKAMDEAEVIIVEDTVSNFSTGFITTYAIQRNKPILVLRTQDKKSHFKDSLLDGVGSETLEIVNYKYEELDRIVKTFLKKYENSNNKTRFNLVLSGVERNYLDWAKQNRGDSRTKLIRTSIRRTIENDLEYQSYLSN